MSLLWKVYPFFSLASTPLHVFLSLPLSALVLYSQSDVLLFISLQADHAHDNLPARSFHHPTTLALFRTPGTTG